MYDMKKPAAKILAMILYQYLKEKFGTYINKIFVIG